MKHIKLMCLSLLCLSVFGCSSSPSKTTNNNSSPSQLGESIFYMIAENDQASFEEFVYTSELLRFAIDSSNASQKQINEVLGDEVTDYENKKEYLAQSFSVLREIALRNGVSDWSQAQFLTVTYHGNTHINYPATIKGASSVEITFLYKGQFLGQIKLGKIINANGRWYLYDIPKFESLRQRL